MTVMITLSKTRSYDLSIGLPQVSRVRMVTTTSLVSGFTGLWFAAPALLPFAEIGWRMVVGGLTIPSGIGYVTLLVAEYRAKRELVHTRWRPATEREVRR